MRESIGTAWLTGVVMAMIALFSGYLAFSINYSKSFRVKDGIIERIQKHNGFDNASPSTLEDIDEFLQQINYGAKGNCYKHLSEDADGRTKIVAGVNGKDYKVNVGRNEMYNYCIMKVNGKGDSTTARADIPSVYYKVIVFFSLQIGNFSIGGNFKTSGITSTLYYPNDVIFGG